MCIRDRLALRDVYAKPIAVWSGPVMRSVRRDGDRMIVAFNHAAGLTSKSSELRGFAIAGADRKFVWADARVDDDKVIVSSANVPDPAAVRYDWATNPVGN